MKPPNTYKRRLGQTLTPLTIGKIWYGKMLEKHNMKSVRAELIQRGLADKINNNTALTAIIKSLKK